MFWLSPVCQNTPEKPANHLSVASFVRRLLSKPVVVLGLAKQTIGTRDVVVRSNSREDFFSNKSVPPHVKDFRLFLDVSVPRSVAEDVEHTRAPGVSVYDWPRWNVNEQGESAGSQNFKQS